MRQLFRKEYAKELEETQQALEAQPVSPAASSGRLPRIEPSASESMPIVEITEAAQDAPSRPSAAPEKTRGFWGSLFKRKK